MRLFCRPLAFCLLLVMPCLSYGQGPTDLTEEEKINHILEAISAREQLREIPQTLMEEFASNPLGLPPAKNEVLISRFEDSFVEDTLFKKFRGNFSGEFEQSLADTVLQRFQSNALKEGLKAKSEFYTLQGNRKRVIRMYELEQDPPPKKRRDVIDKLIKTVGAKVTMSESQAIMFRSIVSAFSHLSDQRNLSGDQIDNIVANYKMQTETRVADQVQRKYMIMYFELDKRILDEVVSFYNSEAGKWLSSSVNRALHKTYRAAADQFVDSIQYSN